MRVVCPCWLFWMGLVCLPGFGSACLRSSTCTDLSDRDRLTDCVHLCKSAIQAEIPALRGGDLFLSMLLSALVPEEQQSGSALRAHGESRRSYSMGHFRWGKPFGRRRRPVKVFASSLDGDGDVPIRARRHLSWEKPARTGSPRLRGGHGSNPPPGLPRRKDSTYRMSHFRWGSPPASRQNGSTVKVWEEKPQRKLSKILKNMLVQDVQRMMG